MKKIMFSDNFGMTQAVVDGVKTVTRRLIPKVFQPYDDIDMMFADFIKPRYRAGEIVAVAESVFAKNLRPLLPCDATFYKIDYVDDENMKDVKWSNKMFMPASLYRHSIEILSARIERLQDITNLDIMREGIKRSTITLSDGNRDTEWGFHDYVKTKNYSHRTKREAFAALIDRINGKGTWESNPWVWRYEFVLMAKK